MEMLTSLATVPKLAVTVLRALLYCAGNERR